MSDVRSGRTGTAVVIQDIHAPPTTCLRKLTDFIEYKNMVPHCQNVKVYDRTEFNNVMCDIFRLPVSLVEFFILRCLGNSENQS